MSNPYVLLSLFVLSAGALCVVCYGIKRYFDDKAASRAADLSALSQVAELRVFVPERFTVFEKALANSIAQFAEIVSATKESELKTKATTAGALMKMGRLPKP